jgi:hypothetical protein
MLSQLEFIERKNKIKQKKMTNNMTRILKRKRERERKKKECKQIHYIRLKLKEAS